jgi:hypothetical protein
MNQSSFDPRTRSGPGRTDLRAPRRSGLPAALAGRPRRRRGPRGLADTAADPATVAAPVDTVARIRQFENSVPGREHPSAVRIITLDPWPTGSPRPWPARSLRSAAGRHAVPGQRVRRGDRGQRQRGDADLRFGGHLHHRALGPGRRQARLRRARRGQPGRPRVRGWPA